MTAALVIRLLWRSLIIAQLIYLSGCATYTGQAYSVQDALKRDDIDLAYTFIEARENYSDRVLNNLNRGMLLQMKRDFIASNKAFEKAKKHINRLHGFSVSEHLGAVIINDLLISYQGARHEQLLLHAYMAMNYIQLDDLDAARVEMLQADVKMREWGDEPDDDPFLRYLSGIIYEALGEHDQALVAYRYALDAYKVTYDRQHIESPALLKKDVLRLLVELELDEELESYKTENDLSSAKQIKKETGQGELIMIIGRGLTPVKREGSITTFANEIENTLRIAIPVYPIRTKPLNAVRIVVDGNNDMLETVENIDGLARSELENEIPSIITRAIARAVLKKKTQHKATDNNAISGLFMTMTNLVTERADTRSWVTLPQDIQLSRQILDAGQHTLTIEMLNNAGVVIDRMTEDVTILPGKMAFVFKHLIAQRRHRIPANSEFKDGSVISMPPLLQ